MDLQNKIYEELEKIKKEKKEEIAKSVFNFLGLNYDDYAESRLEDINANIYTPKTTQRGFSGLIIGDDGTHLTCGSIHPLDYYIEKFKNGQRDGIALDKELESLIQQELKEKAIIEQYNKIEKKFSSITNSFKEEKTNEIATSDDLSNNNDI